MWLWSKVVNDNEYVRNVVKLMRSWFEAYETNQGIQLTADQVKLFQQIHPQIEKRYKDFQRFKRKSL